MSMLPTALFWVGVGLMAPSTGRREQGSWRNAAGSGAVRCYQSCFALAEKNKIRSIAFPAISTGAYGFPLERACHIALRVMIDHLTEREGDERMSVFAVCFSERAFQCYQEVFREL